MAKHGHTLALYLSPETELYLLMQSYRIDTLHHMLQAYIYIYIECFLCSIRKYALLISSIETSALAPPEVVSRLINGNYDACGVALHCTGQEV